MMKDGHNMTLVNEAGAVPVAQFTVPYRGTWNSVAANQVAADVLYDSMNVFIREGKLRQRPGLTLLNSNIFDAPVIGGKMAVTPSNKILLAITKSQLYTLYQSNPVNEWLSDTIANFAVDNHQPVDITFIQVGGDYIAVIANGSYPLKRWIEGQGADPIVATVGSVPQAKSVCTTARRVVALVHPHTLRWTSTLSYTAWPALATATIAQTNDVGLCVRQLGTLDFAVYKERSIYVAKAQAGSDAQAFNIQFVQHVEGPAGVLSVVDANGDHVYMTKNGRVGIFNGSQKVQWIADGLWLFLQSDIDPLYAHKIFGVFDYRLHTVTFHYPRMGDDGSMMGILIINLPLQGSGIEPGSGTAAFLGRTSKPCSYGFEQRFDNIIDRSLLFTSTSGDCQSFIFDELAAADDSTNFDCSMQTGLQPLLQLRHSQVTIESYLERAEGNGHVTVNAVTSDALENKTGTVSDEQQIIDLNSNPVQEYMGFNIPCRFFGLLYSWQSDSVVRYAGASVYGRTVA